MPIPPTGWGAVEILIYDYYQTLIRNGHTVDIINTPDIHSIIHQANSKEYDFVHIQYDDHFVVIPHLRCRNIAITSHYGYLTQRHRYDHHYTNIFNNFVNLDVNIFCLAEEISKIYSDSGKSSDKLFVIPNGVRTDLFRYEEECKLPNSSVFLAKIDFRKRQHVFQNIPNLYFAGNCIEPRFNTNSPNYLGEWSKPHLYENLTNYANLVLLSDGEAHPLVCMEAMAAGLGLVISEFASYNLDNTLPFIDVIPESQIYDIDYVSSVIEKNRNVSVGMRKDIREYVINNFDWNKIVTEKYIPAIKKVIGIQ